MISMPHADSHIARTLQEDNTELAYEFVSALHFKLYWPRTHTHTHTRALFTHHNLWCAGAQVPGGKPRPIRAISFNRH